MEKGSKRTGNDRNKTGNSFKKDGKSGGNKAFTKRGSFKRNDDEAQGAKRPVRKSAPYGEDRPKRTFGENDRDENKRPARKSASFGDERPKRTFRDKDADNDRPRKQWDDREQGGGKKRTFDKPKWEDRGGEERPARKSKEFGEKRSFDKPRRDDKTSEGRPERKGKEFGEKRSFDKPRRDDKSSEGRPERKNKDFGEKRSFDKPRRDDKSSEGRPERKNKDFGEKRTFDKPLRDDRTSVGRPERKSKDFTEKRSFDKPRRSAEDREERPAKSRRSFESEDLSIGARKKEGKNVDSRPFRERNKPAGTRKEEKKAARELKEWELPPAPDQVYNELEDAAAPKREFKSHKVFKKEENFDKPEAEDVMPLNKFIAHSGECSRRDAAELVRQGKVKVNGELILDPGHKVNLSDDVTLLGKKMKPQKGMVYILLNKPKGFITTNDDPQGRKTVMDLVSNSGIDRLFAVGRLDRNTTGLLLMTNDGLLAQKLAHPSYDIKKVYHVTLDKPLTKADFEKVIAGVTLDDGIAKVDALAYLEAKNELGLEIHSGRNRIVRRIFESLGYVVDKLDRVMYAGLTKKNLPRSKWRFLDEREIVLLKHFKS